MHTHNPSIDVLNVIENSITNSQIIPPLKKKIRIKKCDPVMMALYTWEGAAWIRHKNFFVVQNVPWSKSGFYNNSKHQKPEISESDIKEHTII